ncbi:MAG: hypothetical protein HY835_07105 [Anaerolineae bacterium]|nr:hypothetical protein [Anaerolineae bacterium]
MDKFDFNEAPAPKPASRLELWDMLSILMLLLTLCIGAYFIMIFVSPNSRFNPFPPNPVDPNAPPTPTITPLGLVPTWTSTPVNVTQSPTLLPTITLEPSPTFFSLIPPTETPTITPTPKAPYSATINVLQSDVTIPHLQSFGCNWQGVAGSVVDSNNADVVGLAVRLVGTLNGKSIGPNGNLTTVSGTSPEYGRSGFEFMLGTVPVSSKGTLYLQLLDTSGVQAGLPLSDNIYIDTFNDCKKNLILVRFKKN